MKKENAGASPGGFSFALSEMALFNRREYAKTQPLLPDANGNLVSNPNFDPLYQPKYYAQNSSAPIPIFLSDPKATTINKKGKTKPAKMQSYWDAANGTWGGKEHPGGWGPSVMMIEQDDLPGNASVTILAPTADWVTESQLKGFWIADENARSIGDPFRVDSLLYTSNMVMALTRGKTKSEGRMIVNGGLISRDMGILAAGPKDGRPGLELNFDQRVSKELGIKDEGSATLKRTALWVRHYLPDEEE